MEAKAWAPSRWSPEKIRLFLKHMRSHVWGLPSGGDFRTSGITDALMAIAVARSKVALIHRHGFELLHELYPEEKPTQESDGPRRVTSSET